MFFDPFRFFPSFPEADLVETKSHFYLAASLPQVEKESVKVEPKESHTICISGIRSIAPFFQSSSPRNEDTTVKLSEGKDYLILSQERFSGKFERCFHFASSINPDEIQAEATNEELFLTIPKQSSARKPVSISIH